MQQAQKFFHDKLTAIFSPGSAVLDIGGGLRIDRSKGNRYLPAMEWLRPLVEQCDYKILDAVPDYHPDIVGDIHKLPFGDNTWGALICMSVLEHVEDPQKAAAELYRVLKPGGRAFVYVPFLYYYHAERGYYKDYWRFTKDALELIFKKFSTIELQPVRGALATWLHISPLGKYGLLKYAAEWLDRVFKKESSKQVSGYYVLLTK